MDPENQKESDLEKDITYLLCPDRKCNLFYDTTRATPCERNCPKQKELTKIIKCQSCNEIIELPGDHFTMCRIDHKCDPRWEGTASNFRMSGKYILIYKRPE